MPLQAAPASASSARTSPGCETLPRWWMDRMQKVRAYPGRVATACSATGKPGFQINDPYPKTQSGSAIMQSVPS
jgi:hypothetical protein